MFHGSILLNWWLRGCKQMREQTTIVVIGRKRVDMKKNIKDNQGTWTSMTTVKKELILNQIELLVQTFS